MQVAMIKRWGLVIHFVLTLMGWQVGNAQNLVVVDWDSVWTTLPERTYIAQRTATINNSLMEYGKAEVQQIQEMYDQLADHCHPQMESVQKEKMALKERLAVVRELEMTMKKLDIIDSLVQIKVVNYLAQYVKTAYPNWLILPKKDHVLYVAVEHEKTAAVIELLQRNALQVTRDLEQSELIFKRVLQEMGVDKFIALE